jgi:hypothetical protein
MVGYSALGIVERSYQLAKTGNYAGAAEIRRQLLAEGYGQSDVVATFSNPVLIWTLVDLCRHAQGRPKP